MTAILEADPPEPGKRIAFIELLSPANKIPGKGRKLYRRKQARLVRSTTHLVEIDFLRAGEHTVAFRRDSLPANGWDHLVCLHRGRSQTKFNCWPISLPERLPRINVPLSGADADVVVDLQAIVNRCCDSATGRRIDYRGDCLPPLSKENAQWVNDWLRKKKLRK